MNDGGATRRNGKRPYWTASAGEPSRYTRRIESNMKLTEQWMFAILVFQYR